jgi:hypothetical protein
MERPGRETIPVELGRAATCPRVSLVGPKPPRSEKIGETFLKCFFSGVLPALDHGTLGIVSPNATKQSGARRSQRDHAALIHAFVKPLQHA